MVRLHFKRFTLLVRNSRYELKSLESEGEKKRQIINAIKSEAIAIVTRENQAGSGDSEVLNDIF